MTPGNDFYPRSPCGERPPHERAHDQLAPISIHALLAESDTTANEALQKVKISIHALLAESDPTASRRKTTDMNFYPRSPCGERQCMFNINAHLQEFLSTLSLRRATFLVFGVSLVCIFLSTLSLRRATQEKNNGHETTPFLSTLSLRRATPDGTITDTFFGISIHALLAESDCITDGSICLDSKISIHALLAESDKAVLPVTRSTGYFYPRSPCGERLTIDGGVINRTAISIHALLAESDVTTYGKELAGWIFLSTLSLRRATYSSADSCTGIQFLSTLSLRRATF